MLTGKQQSNEGKNRRKKYRLKTILRIIPKVEKPDIRNIRRTKNQNLIRGKEQGVHIENRNPDKKNRDSKKQNTNQRNKSSKNQNAEPDIKSKQSKFKNSFKNFGN